MKRLGKNSYLSHKLPLLVEPAWCAAFVLALIVFVNTATFAAGAQTARAQRVLMLFTESKFAPANVLVEQAARDVLEQSGQPVEFYAEYLDAGRFPDEDHYKLLPGALNS